MDKNNIKLLVIIIVLALVLGGLYWYYQNPIMQYVQNNSENSPSPTPKSTSGGSSSSSGGKISFDQAVKIYANTRIQFNENCVASPSNSTFKKGTTIMLQNSSSKGKTITVDGKGYYIAAYDFALVTLTTTASLPHTMMVDCGTGKNNATIILQQ